MMKNDVRPVIMIVCAICIVPVVVGAVLFVISLPVFFLTKKHWRSFEYWGILTIIIAGSLSALLYFTNIYELFMVYSLTDLQNITQQWVMGVLVNGFHWPAKVSYVLSNKFISVSFKVLPLSLVVAYVILPFVFWSKIRDRIKFKNFKKKPKIKQKEFLKHRENKNKGLFVGIDTKDKSPVFIKERDLGMHCQVLGTTGFGKTSSFLLPLLKHNLEKGNGMLFLDGKGDQESISAFLSLVKACGRMRDLRFFSPIHTDISDKYNPLLHGGPTEIKDRLVGAQIWSEEFYRKKGEDVVQMICRSFKDLEISPSIKKLSRILRNPEDELFKGKTFKDKEVEEDFNLFKANFKSDTKNYGGLASDLNLFCKADFGKIFECEQGEGIELIDAYKKNQVLYFHMPILSFEGSTQRIGRMLIHDLKTMTGYIQNFIDPRQRHQFPVCIDEFASFAAESFIDLINKSRSAGVTITVVHQSMGDVAKISENFARQLLENTNVKAILRIDDPDTVENYSRLAGTKQALKYTYMTDKDLGIRRRSGEASMREVNEFNVDPNVFRNLGIGEGVIIVKSTNEIHKVKFDYLAPSQMSINEIRAMVKWAGKRNSRNCPKTIFDKPANTNEQSIGQIAQRNAGQIV